MLLETLRDGFTTSLDLARWPHSYGSPATSGGRARIPCTGGGFAGLRSATVYTLTGSSVLLRTYPPAPAGATVTAAMSVLVLTGISGTDAGFVIDTAQSAMGLYLREGFADPGALFPAYDPIAHAWLRLREAAGLLYWETSPDSETWTVVRTAPAPPWASNPDLSLLIEATRNNGADNFAEVDNVNLPTKYVSLGTARVRSTGLPLPAVKAVRMGAARMAAAARPIVPAHRAQLGAARTASRAMAMTRRVRPALTLTAAATGSSLLATTSGPQLAATSTSGG
ncbi:hypothetical protein [Streptomyces chryseus]